MGPPPPPLKTLSVWTTFPSEGQPEAPACFSGIEVDEHLQNVYVHIYILTHNIEDVPVLCSVQYLPTSDSIIPELLK